MPGSNILGDCNSQVESDISISSIRIKIIGSAIVSGAKIIGGATITTTGDADWDIDITYNRVPFNYDDWIRSDPANPSTNFMVSSKCCCPLGIVFYNNFYIPDGSKGTLSRSIEEACEGPSTSCSGYPKSGGNSNTSWPCLINLRSAICIPGESSTLFGGDLGRFDYGRGAFGGLCGAQTSSYGTISAAFSVRENFLSYIAWDHSDPIGVYSVSESGSFVEAGLTIESSETVTITIS